jgi:predicted AAA+ superfamily ATPase
MIRGRVEATVQQWLSDLPAVGLPGPRQAGKTTLARTIAATRESVYLDLESPVDREKLSDPYSISPGMKTGS